MTGNEEFDSEGLDALKRAAQALPREIPPGVESWSRISVRIEQTRVRELVPTSASGDVASDFVPNAQGDSVRAPKRTWIRTPQAALLIAASLLIAVTSLVVKREGAIDPSRESRFAADTSRADMTGVFARYDGAATELANDFDRRRALLDPSTVAVMDSCLTTLDNAIRETRNALTEAPDNTTIAELLEVTYQQKLDLLRRAAELSEGSL